MKHYCLPPVDFNLAVDAECMTIILKVDKTGAFNLKVGVPGGGSSRAPTFSVALLAKRMPSIEYDE